MIDQMQGSGRGTSPGAREEEGRMGDAAIVEDLTGDPMGIHQPFGEEEEDGEPHFD